MQFSQNWLALNMSASRGGRRFFAAVIFVLSTVLFSDIAFSSATRTTVGAWNIECTEAEPSQSKPRCIANQLVTAGQDSNKTLLGITVGFDQGHPSPHIIFRLTSGANSQSGAAVKVDQNNAFKVPFSECDVKVCEVRSFIPAELLTQMREGNVMQFAFFIDERQVTYPVVLDGFERTFKTIESNVR